MNLEKAVIQFERIEDDAYSSNLFARANARYILFGVNENRANFPASLESNLNNGSDALAFSYLSIGCTLAESDIFDERTKIALEKGAEFIEYTHLPLVNRNASSKYYLLIGALAYYASFQYSKAFILIKEATDYETDISSLVSAFLKKDFNAVNHNLNMILLELEDYLSLNDEDSIKKLHHYHIVIFAKAISTLMDYLYTGNISSLEKATETLTDLEELLLLEQEPSLWWVTRLFKIISSGFNQSSLWSNIVPLLPKSDNDTINKFISNLIFGKKKIIELFSAQRSALPLIAANKGAVISLPTSSGKTQIAILAILKCLTESPDSKVLYIAPYRSLAFEVENALKESFDLLNFEVSQLYGSGQFGKLDNLILEEASIMIATPEKAKVILRANQEITGQIKLVIIDEGHLLDESQRNVKNELFIEELKIHVRKNNGIIILLSAVLPNTEDIADWITEDPTSSVTENSRLARQRLGILEYRKNSVSLEWMGDEKSFNRNFIKPIPPIGRKRTVHPKDKKFAVGLTALRLSEQGKSVLIFTSMARSVGTYASAILESLDLLYGSKEKHVWKNQEAWEELNLLCTEYDYRQNVEILKYAKYGILLHYGNLHKDVRNVLEKLMRSGNPRIIVATMTLGQGVNLGVSSVILADTGFYNRDKKDWVYITHNEVWNIIGRAGRAFQDIEGKILFAIEDRNQRSKAIDYIENPPKSVISGLLLRIKFIKEIASECKVKFPDLLELIANNNFSDFSSYHFNKNKRNVKEEFYEIFDWIDDTLLSLNMLATENEKSLDDIIRSTLAYIQASDVEGVSNDDVLAFLNARNDAIEEMIPKSSNKKHLVLSSLPLASALAMDQVFDNIVSLGNLYLSSKRTLENKISLLKQVEEIIKNFPSYTFKPERDEKGNLRFSNELIDEARELWLKGLDLSSGSDVTKIISLSNHYFAYTISWVVGAIANKCRILEHEDLAIVFEDLALCCELGLPYSDAAKIYLSGIKSRIATMEIFNSYVYNYEADSDMNIRETKVFLIEYIENLNEEAKHILTKKWLAFINENHKRNQKKILPRLKRFTLPGHPDLKTTRLYVKSVDHKKIFLSSADYIECFEIESTAKWPFAEYANLMNYYFEYDGKAWELMKQT